MRRLLPLALLLAGCTVEIVGSGNVKEEPRTLAPFTSLTVESGIKVTFTTGNQSTRVSADDNVLDHVQTVVEAGKLTVRLNPAAKIKPVGEIKVTLSAMQLTSIAAGVEADVTASVGAVESFDVLIDRGALLTVGSLRGTTLNATASEGSKGTFAGTVKAFTLTASGGSLVLAQDLGAEDVEVELTDNTTATVRAKFTLKGSVKDTAQLTVQGNQLQRDVTVSPGAVVTYQ
jgi:hypothetical protein